MRQSELLAKFKSRLNDILSREDKKFLTLHAYALNEYCSIRDNDLAQAVYEACVNDAFDFECTRFEEFIIAVLAETRV